VAHGAAVERTLERDREIAVLQNAVDGAADRRGALVAIEGPAGAGKTTLLTRAREQAEAAGLTVFSARGGELEGEFPFGVVRQLFEGRLARAGEAEREAAFAGSAGLARDPLGLGGGATEGDGRDRTLPALHGLYWLTANLAAREPLAILIDDVQWADLQSVQWLEYLARRLAELPVVVVMARRLGDARAPVILDELGLDPATVLVQPAPLSADGVAALLHDLLGDDPGPAFVRACQHATGGNPFLIRELASALRDEGITPVDRNAGRITEVTVVDVSRSVIRRLRRLPADAFELARAAAVLGSGTPLSVAARLARLDEQAGATALDALARADLIQPETTIEFVHPLIRQAVYGEQHPAERALTHRAAAEVLRDTGASPEAIASQLLETEPAGDDWVVGRLADAAASVFQTGTPAAAVPYLERALREPPAADQRGGLLHRLGRAQLLSATQDAVETLDEAVRHLSARERADALHDRAHALGLSGRLNEALDAWVVTANAYAEFDPDEAREVTHTRLGIALLMPTAAGEAYAELDRATAPQIGDTLSSARLLATLANQAAFRNEPRDHVAGLVKRALHNGTLADEAGDNFIQFAQAVWCAVFCGELDLAEQHAQRALDRARERGLQIDFQLSSLLLALIEYARGRLWRAEAYGRDALGAAAGDVNQVMLPISLAVLIHPLIERDGLDESARLMEQHDMWGEKITWSPISFPLLVRGRLQLALGRPRQAVADFRQHEELDRRASRLDHAHTPWRSSLALALHALGEDLDEARRLASEELELARAFDCARELGPTLRVAGLLDGGEAGLELLTQSVERLRGSAFELELAKSLAVLGAATRRDGRRTEAREHLTEALDLADRCGALTLAEQVRSELRAAGARPRRTRASGPSALTATERRIAELAATGMTNREIAQAQFVTTKTVETHLASVYRKLDIRGRGRLAEALGESAEAA
jgi:DNA-binding CsgD family transcriptional regulator